MFLVLKLFYLEEEEGLSTLPLFAGLCPGLASSCQPSCPPAPRAPVTLVSPRVKWVQGPRLSLGGTEAALLSLPFQSHLGSPRGAELPLALAGGRCAAGTGRPEVSGREAAARVPRAGARRGESGCEVAAPALGRPRREGVAERPPQPALRSPHSARRPARTAAPAPRVDGARARRGRTAEQRPPGSLAGARAPVPRREDGEEARRRAAPGEVWRARSLSLSPRPCPFRGSARPSGAAKRAPRAFVPGSPRGAGRRGRRRCGETPAPWRARRVGDPAVASGSGARLGGSETKLLLLRPVPRVPAGTGTLLFLAPPAPPAPRPSPGPQPLADPRLPERTRRLLRGGGRRENNGRERGSGAARPAAGRGPGPRAAALAPLFRRRGAALAPASCPGPD